MLLLYYRSIWSTYIFSGHLVNVFYVHLVYFTAILVLFQDKSGNPDTHTPTWSRPPPPFPYTENSAQLRRQGDRNERIFAHWVIVYLLQFNENYISSPHILGHSFPLSRQWINKKWVGLHFGRFFFTSSSGHPVRQPTHTLAHRAQKRLETKLRFKNR
jgi:hypothetical protein